MNSGYNPKLLHQNANLTQMKSQCEQPPFYFGGSPMPLNLAVLRSRMRQKRK